MKEDNDPQYEGIDIPSKEEIRYHFRQTRSLSDDLKPIVVGIIVIAIGTLFGTTGQILAFLIAVAGVDIFRCPLVPRTRLLLLSNKANCLMERYQFLSPFTAS